MRQTTTTDKKYTLFFVFLFSLLNPLPLFSRQSTLDSLLVALDHTIKNEKEFSRIKENRILALKQSLLNQRITPEQRYHTFHQLTREYEAYICDSATLYARRSLSIAEELNRPEWITESKLFMASIQAKSGMFNEAIDILNTIPKEAIPHEWKANYYKKYWETYVYWLEYQDGNNVSSLSASRYNYQDSLLRSLSENSYEYITNYGTYYIESNELDKAEKMLLGYLHQVQPNTRDYSIYTSLLAYLYERKKDTEKQKEYLALSAISDIKASIKENVSLRMLSLLMFEEGNISRANWYIKKSMEDATFYNARLRNIQTARFLPLIDKVYAAEQARQQKILTILLTVVSVLSAILAITIFLLHDRMKKLSRAKEEIIKFNAELNEVNTNLKKANIIKEQFIGSFLEICTEYIQKLNNLKTKVNRKVKTGQINDILKITSSTEDSSKESRELYSNFDKTFLTIYPDFVQEVNNLLQPDKQYPINKDKTLNHELRVFALIKLGITDSHQIATFLHYSLRTVYNYRSRVKSKALHPEEDFEEKIKNTGY